MPCIYAITNLEDDYGTTYIGSTIRPIQKRWDEHRRRLEGNRHENPKLQNAWNKYGSDAFQFLVLETFRDSKKVTVREQYWLDFFLSNGGVYNIGGVAACPARGRVYSEEHRRRLSEAHKGYVASEETRRKQRIKGLLFRHTPESKSKISKATQGENHAHSSLTDEEIRGIRQMWKTGQYRQRELAKIFSTGQWNISRIVNYGRWKHIGGA